MAKKESKKLTINKLQKIAEENFDNNIKVDYYGESITIKETIGFENMLSFVNDVVGSVFLDGGSYMPELVDFLVRSSVLRYYAGFSMPQNINEHYRLVYETDAFDVIMQYINKAQFDDIVRSINKKIQFMCDGHVYDLTEKMQNVVDSFGELNSKMEEIFKDVDTKDVANVANAVGNNGIREDLIVGAYIDQLNKKKEERKMPVYDGPINETVVGVT